MANLLCLVVFQFEQSWVLVGKEVLTVEIWGEERVRDWMTGLFHYYLEGYKMSG